MTQERLAGEVVVTQSDRDAAAAWMRGLEDFQEIGAGGYGDLVQAFARHRLATVEECAKLCEQHEETQPYAQREHIATAIRSLAPPPAVVGEGG